MLLAPGPVPATVPAMQSVHLQRGPDTHPSAAAEYAAGDAKRLLQTIWWVSWSWVERLAVSDPQRVRAIHLGLLADDLVRVGDYSSAAMKSVRILLCTSCRRLNAAQGKCQGQGLDRCQVLRNSGRGIEHTQFAAAPADRSAKSS